eukprot:COSAG06_NODE_6778_length_2787_cov_1.706101_1_plen_499_part_01
MLYTCSAQDDELVVETDSDFLPTVSPHHEVEVTADEPFAAVTFFENPQSSEFVRLVVDDDDNDAHGWAALSAYDDYLSSWASPPIVNLGFPYTGGVPVVMHIKDKHGNGQDGAIVDVALTYSHNTCAQDEWIDNSGNAFMLDTSLCVDDHNGIIEQMFGMTCGQLLSSNSEICDTDLHVLNSEFPPRLEGSMLCPVTCGFCTDLGPFDCIDGCPSTVFCDRKDFATANITEFGGDWGPSGPIFDSGTTCPPAGCTGDLVLREQCQSFSPHHTSLIPILGPDCMNLGADNIMCRELSSITCETVRDEGLCLDTVQTFRDSLGPLIPGINCDLCPNCVHCGGTCRGPFCGREHTAFSNGDRRLGSVGFETWTAAPGLTLVDARNRTVDLNSTWQELCPISCNAQAKTQAASHGSWVPSVQICVEPEADELEMHRTLEGEGATLLHPTPDECIEGSDVCIESETVLTYDVVVDGHYDPGSPTNSLPFVQTQGNTGPQFALAP